MIQVRKLIVKGIMFFMCLNLGALARGGELSELQINTREDLAHLARSGKILEYGNLGGSMPSSVQALLVSAYGYPTFWSDDCEKVVKADIESAYGSLINEYKKWIEEPYKDSAKYIHDRGNGYSRLIDYLSVRQARCTQTAKPVLSFLADIDSNLESFLVETKRREHEALEKSRFEAERAKAEELAQTAEQTKQESPRRQKNEVLPSEEMPKAASEKSWWLFATVIVAIISVPIIGFIMDTEVAAYLYGASIAVIVGAISWSGLSGWGFWTAVILITAVGFIPRWFYQKRRRLVKEQRRAEEEAEKEKRRAEDEALRIEQGCEEVRSNFANDDYDKKLIFAKYGEMAGKEIFEYKQKVLSLLLDKNSEDFRRFSRVFKQLWLEFCVEHEGEFSQGSIPEVMEAVNSMQSVLDRIALEVVRGDPAAYARYHYGRPDDVESKIGPRVEREVWKYDEYQKNRYRRKVTIKNGVIDSIEEK